MVDPPHLKSDTNPPVTPTLPVAAAPPPAHQHPPGQTRTTFTWHVEEGGSGAKRRTPLPAKPRREAQNGPGAGRRPVALRGETHRAKQMEGNTRRETGVPSASALRNAGFGKPGHGPRPSSQPSISPLTWPVSSKSTGW